MENQRFSSQVHYRAIFYSYVKFPEGNVSKLKRWPKRSGRFKLLKGVMLHFFSWRTWYVHIIIIIVDMYETQNLACCFKCLACWTIAMTIFYIGWLNQESEKVVASSSALSSTLALRCRRNSQNAPRRRLQKHSRQHQPKVVRYHFLYPEYGRNMGTGQNPGT